MKRKSIFTFCAIALMLVLSLSVLTACNKKRACVNADTKPKGQYQAPQRTLTARNGKKTRRDTGTNRPVTQRLPRMT